MNYKLQLNMIQSKPFFNVDDIKSFMCCGKNKAYQIMREIKSNYPGFGTIGECEELCVSNIRQE